MSVQLSNLRSAYLVLQDRVRIALRTQLGDAERLKQQKEEVTIFMTAADLVRVFQVLHCLNYSCQIQHRPCFPAAEYSILQSSLVTMIDGLNRAKQLSSDPSDGPAISISHRQSNGKRGRPRVYIEPHFLSFALGIRGPTGLAPAIGCHPKTIRRRALENGLVHAGAPVYQDTSLPDGTIQCTWTSSAPAISRISDDYSALDFEVAGILELFPRFGRAMIAGVLQARGYRVPRDRIEASYRRVHGSPAIFGDRRIIRRVYSVPGVNSLWHHDGQHGMASLFFRWSLTKIFPRSHPLETSYTRFHRWKVTIHCGLTR